jgi:hypothetical protein
MSLRMFPMRHGMLYASQAVEPQLGKAKVYYSVTSTQFMRNGAASIV